MTSLDGMQLLNLVANGAINTDKYTSTRSNVPDYPNVASLEHNSLNTSLQLDRYTGKPLLVLIQISNTTLVGRSGTLQSDLLNYRFYVFTIIAILFCSTVHQ